MYALDVSKAAPGFERIVPQGTVIDQVAHGFIFTEGPVWDPVLGALTFSDIRGDRLVRWTPGKGTETFMSPTGKANGLSLDLENRIVVAGWGARTAWRIEHDGSTTVLASHWDGKKINTPNDLVVKSDGSVWFTDTVNGLFIPGMCTEDVQRYLDFEGVFRVNSDGTGMALAIEDTISPNGLCFSPDQSRLYVNEPARRRIRVWDVGPDNNVSNGRHFYSDTGTEQGNFDGMKVDVEGNVYVSGSAGIHVIDPNGQLLGRIHFPHQPRNFCWGGPDWRTLYLTCLDVVDRVRLGIPGVPHGEANRQQALASVVAA